MEVERIEAAEAAPERWRAVPGWDGYEVSDQGRVRSWRIGARGAPRRRTVPLLLKLSRQRSGYLDVGFGNTNRRGEYVHWRVSRLVLTAFVGPCPEGMEAAHLNGVRDDNRLANLQWVTHAENMRHVKVHRPGLQEELGRRLGQMIAERYNPALLRNHDAGEPSHFAKIGAIGGGKVKAARGPEYFREIGRKGGAARVATAGPGGMAEVGRLGGAAMKAKFGRS
jgi:general stress protein YciG